MYSDEKLKQIRLLIYRLERLSADSIWSHRASGIRGSLLKYLDELEDHDSQKTSGNLVHILDQGYYILEQAAKLSLTRKRIKVVNASTPKEFGDRISENNFSPE